MKETELSPDKNPLDWWKGRESSYPQVAKIASHYVSAPATSVPTERDCSF